MKLGDKLSKAELNTLLNSWPEGTPGHAMDAKIIDVMDDVGANIGYGMAWKLPDDFEDVANK
jgi:hypothetical protein